MSDAIDDTVAVRARAAEGRSPEPAVRRPNLIQSVDRALSILESLAEMRGGVSLMELSLRLGLNSSTCHHLLTTMARRGFVGQDLGSKEYHLGNKIFELSDARARQIDVVKLAMPTLVDLNERTGESVHLATLQGRDLVTVAKLDSRHAVKVDSGWVGKADAAHATATGKAILAWLPEAEIRAILSAKGMRRFTENTIISADELIPQLALVRRHGYAEDREEFQPGVMCVGTAVRDHTGAVVAAFSCSVPTMRATEEMLENLKELVKAAAARTSEELGSRPPK